MPPREGAPRGPGGSSPHASEHSPIAVTATLPRRPFVHERWKDAESVAHRIGLSLDTTTRKLIRAVLEGASVLCTELRSGSREAAPLVAAALLPQTALVIAPETPQLADLRERLERAAVSAVVLNEARGDAPNRAVLDRITAGAVKVVFCTPRWLADESVLAALGAAGLSFVMVLEAQRLSTWSHEPSPAHTRIAAPLSRLGRPPVVAFAPGASSAVKHEVTEALMPAPPEVVEGPVVRANIALSVRYGRGEVRQRALVEAVRRAARPTLVLAASPRDVEAIFGALRAIGLPAHRYHDELRAGTRAAELLEFSMPGDRRILVATSAFAPVAGHREEDPEGVPLRYGRRATKSDIRSLIRFQPPTSLEQLVDELALVGRDGQPAEAFLFYDPSDRPALEAEVESARPSGEQLLLFGKALESITTPGGTITTEALALAARSSRRSVESLAMLLHGMGLVSSREGWLRPLAPQHTLHRELQRLAERYVSVRALDARRIADVAELAGQPGCRAARLRRLLGEADASACGVCQACTGAEGSGASSEAATPAQRHAPARRFMVTAAGAADQAASTFHSDRRTGEAGGVLTAKLADFGR